MRILVIGATGMLGKDFVSFFSKLNGYEVYAISRNKSFVLPYSNIKIIHIDVTDSELFSSCIKEIDPQIIIHSAALTNIDACEENKDYALWLHSNIIKVISLTCPKAKFVYISTDSVFNGYEGNYSENDIPDPLNYYATTKYLGEKNTSALMNDYIIVRTNIYGYHLFEQPSLSEWALSNLKKGQTCTGFTDVFFNPVYTGQLTTIVKKLIDINYQGIINLSSDTFVSKYQFLKMVAEHFGYDPNLILGKPFDSRIFKAPRSNNTTLNTSLLKEAIGFVPNLSEGIALFKIEYIK
jgi:dTDP-4-dehydrorhamnose reductase